MEMKRTTGLLFSLIAALVLAACGGGGGGTGGSGNGGGSTPTYSVGGTVSGLVGTLVLQNNSGDNLTLTSIGNFSFATKLSSGAAYSVSILTSPAGQHCSVTNGAGTIVSANISNVTVACFNNLLGGAIQGTQTTPLNPAGTVAIYAGQVGVQGGVDGTGVLATFKLPSSITSDGVNLYVADSALIRKIDIASGAVTTLAGSGVAGYADGTGAAASFNNPQGITTDGTNLYVTDAGNRVIRQIVIATGVVTTLAGQSGVAGNADGTGTAATFTNPWGITTDGTNLFVSDWTSHLIRKIVIATGVVTTLAGSVNGMSDGTGAAASFSQPAGLTTDGTNLYVADSNCGLIRQVVISTGVVTTIAGGSCARSEVDGVGAVADFKFPVGITTDGPNLYVTDGNGQTVRKVVISTRTVSTLAGVALTTGSADGTGAAATFNLPYGIATDGVSLYVAERGNNTIRKMQ